MEPTCLTLTVLKVTLMEIQQQIAFTIGTCRWGPEQWPDVWGGNQWLFHSPEAKCRCCPDCNRLEPPLPYPSKAWPAAESSWGRNRRGGERRSKNVLGGGRKMIVICLFLCSILQGPQYKKNIWMGQPVTLSACSRLPWLSTHPLYLFHILSCYYHRF